MTIAYEWDVNDSEGMRGTMRINSLRDASSSSYLTYYLTFFFKFYSTVAMTATTLTIITTTTTSLQADNEHQ